MKINSEAKYIMIRKFSVKNFKGFKDEIVLDLSKARDYTFNNNLVKNGLVNKGIIYGKNGTGKSNLGFALYDLTVHLTDKQKPAFTWYSNYRNLDSDSKLIEFKYEFNFDNDIYIYSYGKTTIDQLQYEKIEYKGKTLLYYDYLNPQKSVFNLKGIETLQIELKDNRLSILKYIYRNTSPVNPVIQKIIQFAEGMLWFRCLNDGNGFIGLMSGGSSMDEIVIQNNRIHQFEEFLAENDLHYKLEARIFNNQNVLIAKFDNGEALFSSIISTGTQALWLYFCWSIYFEKVSFLFLDEFDAFYHYETAEIIFKAINNQKNMQSFVTSHNTYLMRNSITRPDCCFILTDGKVCSLSECTDKEIREAHNLEKMYRNGAFTE